MKKIPIKYIMRSKIQERFGGQWRLAQHLKVHETTVSAVLNGRRVLAPAERKRWAKAIGVDPTDFDGLVK